jgi:hypothetical protein
MNKYEIILYWSEEDQAFIADVPELPGCAADGPLANAEVVKCNGLAEANPRFTARTGDRPKDRATLRSRFARSP